MPHIGGLGMGVLFLTAAMIALSLFKTSQALLLGILIPSMSMLFFEIIDDKREFSVNQKFFIQIISASLLILSGIRTHIVYIGDTANILITFIWVIGITNAFNHLDIMDGLAAAIATIISFAFFITAIICNNPSIAFLSLSLTGIALSFLAYNFPPAKIYMGNSGSHFLGFVFSAIALVMTYASIEKKIALLNPLLILGMPILDTSFVILMRIKKGKSALEKSNDHLALRFLKLGYSKKQTLFYMSSMSVILALFGILLRMLPNFIGFLIICLIIIASLKLIKKMGKINIES
jgi:UDP-GlcNAc:undecaprenyl-phosphate GlcNAc-1-phosphate transferase